MTQCPYPEMVTDQVSGRTEPSLLYLVWHEGYEAHKFAMANQSIRLASLVVKLETEIRKRHSTEKGIRKTAGQVLEARGTHHNLLCMKETHGYFPITNNCKGEGSFRFAYFGRQPAADQGER